MNTVYKWIPYQYWQVTAYENWLKQQALSGFELQHAGKYWGRFKKTTPKQMEYRISMSQNRLDEEGMTDLDWIKIDQNKDFILYGSALAGHKDGVYKYPEEYLEDVKNRTKQQKTRTKEFKISLGIIIGMVLLLYISEWMMMGGSFNILKLIQKDNRLWGFLILVYGVGWYRSSAALKGLKALQHNREEDVASERPKYPINKGIELLLSMLIMIVFVTTLYGIGYSTRPLPMEDTSLPLVSLAVLEKDGDFAHEPEDEAHRWQNAYEHKRNLLARHIYEASERGVITHEQAEQKCYLEQELYELNFKGMTQPLAQALMDKYDYAGAFKEIEVPGLDYAYSVERNQGVQLVAIQAHRVLYLEYIGDATLEEILEEVVRKITFEK